MSPDTTLTPSGNVHLYELAVEFVAAVNVNGVVVPINGPTAVIAAA